MLMSTRIDEKPFYELRKRKHPINHLKVRYKSHIEHCGKLNLERLPARNKQTGGEVERKVVTLTGITGVNNGCRR